MLVLLSIRDVVLIEKLDLVLHHGLTVLTGETGAGKSILLDSLGLALGERASASLIRVGAAQAMVSACFEIDVSHPVHALLAEQGIMQAEPDEPLVLRRTVSVDGRSRATLNDQPVGLALLRRVASLLVEIEGQHEQQGLADAASHLDLLDQFGGLTEAREAVASDWRAWTEATAALSRARAELEVAAREEIWLRQSVEDLAALSPQPNEEDTLASMRQALQANARRAEAITAARAEIAPRDRRDPGPAAALRAAGRVLQRLLPDPAIDPTLAALDAAETALAEAEGLLDRLASDSEADPRLLDRTEERLFALRAGARKHAVPVAALPALLATLRARLTSLEEGATHTQALADEATNRRAEFEAACSALSEARAESATRLAEAVGTELRPLRLDRARFVVSLPKLAPDAWTARGAEQASFLIAANPGQEPGPLARVASGGELSRLMLALKVVLAGRSAVPTLVFDEVDSGIGGATAAAVGDRLAAIAHAMQVLVVTHSPQVAARGDQHLRISKHVARAQTEIRAEPLAGQARREEIARMLAGETITDAARAAADSLLGAA
ncbi:DNA repair protein RecN [Lichenicoccus sp.]|uniref:DNA repair protein RecN n=1 Tax=Lichenicoccus sp. TaxID=2781899 RepID=UPI003D0F1069